jgi:hypothetical protein
MTEMTAKPATASAPRVALIGLIWVLREWRVYGRWQARP